MSSGLGEEVELPASWDWARFSIVARVASNLVDPADWRSAPHIAPNHIQRDTGKLLPHKTIEDDGVTSNKHLFKSGQILYSKIRPYLNKCVVARFDGLCSADMYPIDSRIVTAYLHQYMLSRSFVAAVSDAAGSRTVLPKTNKTQMAAVPVPIAPLPEQRRIVAAIETQLTRLDAAVASLERVRANLKRARASVLKAAVGGRLVPTEAELARQEGRSYEHASVLLERILEERRRRHDEAQVGAKRKKKYKPPIEPEVEGLGDLPEGWVWATVDQVSIVGTGATPKRNESRFWTDGTIAWITSGAVNQRFIERPNELVTEFALAKTNLTLYPAGTLVVAMYGEGKTRGKCATTRLATTTNQALAAMDCSMLPATFTQWLEVFFNHNYEAIRRHSSGGVQPNLNLGIVKATLVPLPPTTEHIRIVAEAERRLSVLDAIDRTVSLNLRRCERLRQSILKRAFEGRLVPQDPNDEPASELLARIQAEAQAQ